MAGYYPRDTDRSPRPAAHLRDLDEISPRSRHDLGELDLRHGQRGVPGATAEAMADYYPPAEAVAGDYPPRGACRRSAVVRSMVLTLALALTTTLYRARTLP